MAEHEYNISYVNAEIALTFVSESISLDLIQYHLDVPLQKIGSNDQVRSNMDNYYRRGSDVKPWTSREAVKRMSILRRCPRIVASPSHVTNEQERLVKGAYEDRIPLASRAVLRDFENIMELAIPELHKCDIINDNYSKRSYKKRIFDGLDVPPISRYNFNYRHTATAVKWEVK